MVCSAEMQAVFVYRFDRLLCHEGESATLRRLQRLIQIRDQVSNIRFLDPDGGCRRIFWEVVWHLFFWEPGVQSHKMDQRDTRQRWSCSDSHSFRVFRMAPLKSASQSAF